MPLRFATYNCNTLTMIAKTRKLAGDLPVVIGLLYYQGKLTPYPYSMDLLDLFADKRLAAKHLFKPKLIDVGQLSDEEIAKHGQFAPAEFLFKRAVGRNLGRRGLRGFFEQVKISYNIADGLPPEVLTMIRYALEISDLDRSLLAKEVIRAFPENVDEIMTTADQLREEGELRKARDIALRSLKAGSDLQFVKKITQLPMSEIRVLLKEINKNKDG